LPFGNLVMLQMLAAFSSLACPARAQAFRHSAH
jgi:hypothetical protein